MSGDSLCRWSNALGIRASSEEYKHDRCTLHTSCQKSLHDMSGKRRKHLYRALTLYLPILHLVQGGLSSESPCRSWLPVKWPVNKHCTSGKAFSVDGSSIRHSHLVPCITLVQGGAERIKTLRAWGALLPAKDFDSFQRTLLSVLSCLLPNHWNFVHGFWQSSWSDVPRIFNETLPRLFGTTRDLRLKRLSNAMPKSIEFVFRLGARLGRPFTPRETGTSGTAVRTFLRRWWHWPVRERNQVSMSRV